MTTATLTHSAERRSTAAADFFRNLAERFRTASTRRMIESLDDRMLRDIGLTRGDLTILLDRRRR